MSFSQDWCKGKTHGFKSQKPNSNQLQPIIKLIRLYNGKLQSISGSRGLPNVISNLSFSPFLDCFPLSLMFFFFQANSPLLVAKKNTWILIHCYRSYPFSPKRENTSFSFTSEVITGRTPLYHLGSTILKSNTVAQEMEFWADKWVQFCSNHRD